MIKIHQLNKQYQDKWVLRDIQLTIPRGGLISLIGPNGAGKSTLLSAIGRLVTTYSGEISIDDHPVKTTPGDVLARLVAMQRQENHFVTRLTVRELVSFGRYPYSKGRLTANDHQMIQQALVFLQLNELADRYLDQLSGGQRQRVYVAMVLCQDTPYILLDEPLNNLDMKNAVMMMQLIRRAADELGKTVITVIHDINFASVYSDRIIAMKDGAIVFDGTAQQIMQTEQLRAIFELDVHIAQIGGKSIGIYF
jgi:iron complex transport system ATP-binding protein